MKTILWISSIVLLFGTGSCKKEKESQITPPVETFTKFPPPSWKADETGRYPATMTAVLALPATLEANKSDNDQIAAFINDECRAVGESVTVGTKTLSFALIRGMADEQNKIVFKYYQAKTGYLYQSGSELNFLIDAVYGTAQNPKLLLLSQVK